MNITKLFSQNPSKHMEHITCFSFLKFIDHNAHNYHGIMDSGHSFNFLISARNYLESVAKGNIHTRLVIPRFDGTNAKGQLFCGHKVLLIL